MASIVFLVTKSACHIRNSAIAIYIIRCNGFGGKEGNLVIAMLYMVFSPYYSIDKAIATCLPEKTQGSYYIDSYSFL